ncbi:DUF4262 domain-containing protein [Gordonia shandongensis]|uniref:DUF4262 domain-containing protein n=1 Tax=Gordonia shandongensis TaxID=376351 RepID=UPI000414988B|nr:DUF4262 domain-containing protein [Gordonia shandongensis]
MCEFDPRCTGHDDLIDDAAAQIAAGRWAVTAVLGDAAHSPVAYTTGLTEHGLPELVVTGLPTRLAACVLSEAAETSVSKYCRGTPYRSPHVSESLNRRVRFQLVTAIDTDVLRLTRLFYGDRFRADQMVWPDQNGLYPWQFGYSVPSHIQPLLGVPTEDAA